MAEPKPKKNPFAGISNVKLKKVQKVNDRSAAQLTGYLTNDQIEEYDQYIESFDIEKWYEPLKDITFPTKYVQLKYEEGVTLKDISEQITTLKKQIASTDDADVQNKLKQQIKSIDLSKLNDLSSRINAVINTWKNEDQKSDDASADFGVFVKLSSRSAKDATDAEERLQMLFAKYCETNNATTNNERVYELLKAATHCMKVQNAKQVISMFINSERIHHDVAGALKYGKDKFKQNVVIRKWIPIDIDMEFRGFVYKSKLNAVSQYNHFIHFKRLTQMKDAVQKQLQDFFEEKVKEKLKTYEGYVIDFAICGKDLDRVLIIELNPFMQSTDAALFSWKEEMDQLKNGPFEFRIRNNEPTKQIHVSYKYRVLLGWEN
eukprot:695313_1